MPDRGHPIIELNQQLGNQIFQYAFGQELAWRSGQKVSYAWVGVQRSCRLNEILPNGYTQASRGEMLAVGRLLGDRSDSTRLKVKLDRLGRRGGRQLSKLGGWPKYDQESINSHFKPEMFEHRGRCVLWGFFQSERYFAHVGDDIDRAIQLPTAAADDVFLGLEHPIVSVSFRRGDYALYDAMLPPSYYDHAVSLMRDRLGDMSLVTVGDDLDFIELMAERLSKFGPTVVGSSKDRSDVDDLGIIAAADHNVIANSSFAWWGAWLAERRVHPEHHLVIAPRPWFKDRQDIIPDRWITLDWA